MTTFTSQFIYHDIRAVVCSSNDLIGILHEVYVIV